jgi:hypothetical protein
MLISLAIRDAQMATAAWQAKTSCVHSPRSAASDDRHNHDGHNDHPDEFR